MTSHFNTMKSGALACALAALGPQAMAQAGGAEPKQAVNPAPVNYWMDISTGQPMLGSGMMGLAMKMGGGSEGFGDAFGGRDNWFGAANQGMDGKRVDIAIFDRRQSGQVKADQTLPASVKLGASLPIRPPVRSTGKTPFDERSETPPAEGKARITIKTYWGCSATVRPGQPNVQTVEFDSRTGVGIWGEAVRSRVESDRGATSNRNSSFWPNRENGKRVPDDASLAGVHKVSGAGLPDSLSFTIGSAQDFLPAMGLTSSGSKEAALRLGWSPLAQATAYFVNATGIAMSEGRGGGMDEMVFTQWSSSEVPESGDGLVDYLSNANQDRFLKEKAILPASQTSCEIPAGIFTDSMFVNARGVAYGRELNLVHPPRPEDVKVAWDQEWTARVRVKSVATLMVGLEDMMSAGMAGAMAGGEETSQLPKCPAPGARDVVADAVLSQIPGGGLLNRRKRDKPAEPCQP